MSKILGKIIALILYLTLLLLGGVNWYALYLINQEVPDVEQLRHILYWTGFGAIAWASFLIVGLLCAGIFGHFLKYIFSGKSAFITIFVILSIMAIGILDILANNWLGGQSKILSQLKSDGKPARTPETDQAQIFIIVSAILGSITFFLAIVYYSLKMFATRAKKNELEELKQEESKA